jgi:hypothetical protein
MIPTSLDTAVPTLQPMPLALVFSARLLLTEKALVKDDGFTAVIRTEIRTTHTTIVTPILKAIPGYIHGGLND